jgi:phage baseplate assembly protein W
MIVNTYTSFRFPFQFGEKGSRDEGRVGVVGGKAEIMPSFPEIEESVNAGIRQVILTDPGERVMNSNFGVGASSYVFAPLNEHTKGLLAYNVQDQLELWEPRVRIQDLNSRINIGGSSIRFDMSLELTEFNQQTALSFVIGF